MSEISKSGSKPPFWSWGAMDKKTYFISSLLLFFAHCVFYFLFATFKNMAFIADSTSYTSAALWMIGLMFLAVFFVMFISTKRLVDAGWAKSWMIIPLLLSPLFVGLPPLVLVMIIIFGLLPSKN